MTFLKEFSLFFSSSLLILSLVMVCAFMMRILYSPLLMKNIDFASGYDGTQIEADQTSAKNNWKSLILKKNLYENIGKLPRQPGLETFVDSWQRENTAIKRQKSQQNFFFMESEIKKKIVIQGCQGNKNLRGQIPERKKVYIPLPRLFS